MIRYSKIDKAVRKRERERDGGVGGVGWRWRWREGWGWGESYYQLSQCLQQHGLMIELRMLTGVGESFCELHFYIVVLFKCKQDRLFIIA